MGQIELGLQKKVRDSIKEDGGFAQIISHRFVVGVPDMMAKVRTHPSSTIIEVKQQAKPIRSETVKLDATALQIKSLNNWANAGTPAGILSFLVVGGRAQKKYYHAGMFAVPWSEDRGEFYWNPLGDIRVPVSDHFPVDTQCRVVVGLIHTFAEEFMENFNEHQN